MDAVARLQGLAHKIDRVRNVRSGIVQGLWDQGSRARCTLKCRDYLKNARTMMVQGAGDGDSEGLRSIVKGLKVLKHFGAAGKRLQIL